MSNDTHPLVGKDLAGYSVELWYRAQIPWDVIPGIVGNTHTHARYSGIFRNKKHAKECAGDRGSIWEVLVLVKDKEVLFSLGNIDQKLTFFDESEWLALKQEAVRVKAMERLSSEELRALGLK